jgi:trans-aconitate methyltransferase
VSGVDWDAGAYYRLSEPQLEWGPEVLARIAFTRAETVADVVFSTATFHWIHDHDRLFRSIFTALKPGGRLRAQCGPTSTADAADRRR